jgi:protein O-GlcNAc transferase
MGFCASSGAPYMHHIVSDRVASPPELRGQFSEGLMLVPNSYFVNDHRQQQKWAHVGHKIPDRSSFKELPAKGRVAACFNQLYKIDPPVFEAWMNLLKRSPGTVLWLLKFPQVAVANIRKEAKKRGVGPDRIAFGETLAKTLYLEVNHCPPKLLIGRTNLSPDSLRPLLLADILEY